VGVPLMGYAWQQLGGWAVWGSSVCKQNQTMENNNNAKPNKNHYHDETPQCSIKWHHQTQHISTYPNNYALVFTSTQQLCACCWVPLMSLGPVDVVGSC